MTEIEEVPLDIQETTEPETTEAVQEAKEEPKKSSRGRPKGSLNKVTKETPVNPPETIVKKTSSKDKTKTQAQTQSSV